MQKFTLIHKDEGHILLNFIAKKLTLSKKKAKQLLDKRLVFVNKKRVWIASYQLKEGDSVEVITLEPTHSEFQKDAILFKDNYYLIVSKPPDVITNGPESLESNLRKHFKDKYIQAVHRLDKDTSGAVIFAMNNDTFECMKALFKKNCLKKA